MVIADRRGLDRSLWKPPVPTTKLVQRQVALQLCGWSLREDELRNIVKRYGFTLMILIIFSSLVTDGRRKDSSPEQHAGLSSRSSTPKPSSCFYAAMVRGLSVSTSIWLTPLEDESHQIMSGTIAALSPLSNATLKNSEVREHYSRLTKRIQDPYFRMIITHMAVGDWLEVLKEDTIPFRERLAIAFQFLDDKTLTSTLRRLTDNACLKGNIEGIIITGLTKMGMKIIQAYVDRTGDVQTAAILSSYVCPVKFKDPRAERWLETYRDLLDGFKLHHERVGFDIERGQLLSEAIQTGNLASEEWVPRQILIRCHYCNKTVNGGIQEASPTGLGQKCRVRKTTIFCELMLNDLCASLQRVPTAIAPCQSALSA